MDTRTEELIRLKAFELSQLPERMESSAIDNWLDAERLILGGLAEEGATYAAAEDLSDDQTAVETPNTQDASRARSTSGNGRSSPKR